MNSRGKKCIQAMAILCALGGSYVLATSAPPSNDSKLKFQLTKKLQLVEQVVSDIEQKSAARLKQPGLFADSVNYTKKQWSLAQQAIDDNQLQKAKQHADQAVINMTYARSFVQKPLPDARVTKQEYNTLKQSVDDFQQSLNQTLTEQADEWGEQQRQQVSQLQTQAQRNYSQGNLVEAKKRLDDAYRILVMTLSKLKDKQTTLIRLDFSEPKNEFDYKVKRFASFSILIERQREQNVFGEKKERRLKDWQQQAQTLHTSARIAANKEDFALAIELMEKANEQLKKALRATGLNIF
ncbi:hypothetical protein [Thalassotalea aquiviva]|uniref:hypothetical protein n=1 Tax=Thalassotalea aquiviva TaxID=3242415 RepID=UPI00352BB795